MNASEANAEGEMPMGKGGNWGPEGRDDGEEQCGGEGGMTD